MHPEILLRGALEGFAFLTGWLVFSFYLIHGV